MIGSLWICKIFCLSGRERVHDVWRDQILLRFKPLNRHLKWKVDRDSKELIKIENFELVHDIHRKTFQRASRILSPILHSNTNIAF